MTIPAEYAARLVTARAALVTRGSAVMLVDHGELLAWLTPMDAHKQPYRT